MSNGNLIKENGFFCLNAKITHYGYPEYALFTIYFIQDYMIFEKDIVKSAIRFDDQLFEFKYNNRKKFEQKLIKESWYRPFSNMRRMVGLFEVNGSQITCSFIGENSDRPNVNVTLKRMWLPLFGTDYYLTVRDERSLIVSSEKITFCSYP